MNKGHFLYTADINYFSHMYTSIYSLLENNSTYPLTIYIIEQNFTCEEIKKIDKLISLYDNADLKIYDWNESMKKCDVPTWRGSDIANARLFAGDILDIDKVLYIDSDTIVVNSLIELFNTDELPTISAILESQIPTHIKSKVEKYYNSGIILFNYNLWRKEDCTKKICDTFNNFKNYLIFPDQDLLNLAFNEIINPLKLNYNITPLYVMLLKYPIIAKKYFQKNEYYDYDDVIKSLDEPYIFHMINYLNTKPWIKNNVHPFNNIYEYYRKQWDEKFEKIDNNSLINNYQIFSFLNILSNILISETMNHKIKGIVKKKIMKLSENSYFY